MDAQTERQVWRRACNRCEYCRMPQALYAVPHQIDHIIARKHGGPTTLENLALACFHCNAHKGPNIAGLESGDLVRLFNPRTDIWSEHFEWLGAILIGRTPVGRATVNVLAINHPYYIAVREALLEEKSFPPHDD